MTTRTVPPTRRSTSATVVSQSCSACHQRRITSSLVQASNTAWAGAWKVRSMRSVVPVLMSPAPAGGAGAPPARCGRAARLPPRRRATAAAPPVALPRRGLSRGVTVLVVQVPPLVRRGLRVALGRVLPILLATQQRHVQVRPGGPHRLVAAVLDPVGAEDPV